MYTSLLANQFAPDALFVDHHFQIVYIHGNAGSYLRLPGKDINFNLLEALEGEELAAVKSGVSRAFKQEEPIRYENFKLKKGFQNYYLNLKFRQVCVENKKYLVLIEFHRTHHQDNPPPDSELIQKLQNEERTENQIGENNYKLNLVLEASQTGIWEWNMQTNEVFWDEKTKHIFGYFDKEFDQRMETYLSHIHPEDIEKLQKAIEDTVQHNAPFKSELRIIWDDQSIHHVIGHGTIIHNAAGEAVKMLGTCMDITDITHKDEKISRFGKLLEDSYIEILICDAQSLQFIDVNLGARTNLGYSMEELSNMTPLDIKPAFTYETYQQLIRPLLQGEKEKLVFETYHQRKDKTTYPVLVNLQLSTYENRKVLIANIQDISPLVEAQQKLQLSKERLDFAIKGTSDGVWDRPDMKSNKFWWSPKFYELLGLEDQEIEATIENYRKLMHPEDASFSKEDLALSVKENKVIEAELRLYHKTEGYKWFRNRGQVFYDKEGNPTRMSGAISDIHQRKLAEFQYTRTNQMLKQANEYLDNFVFTVAHDLRSPVANLKSLVELFKAKVNAHDPIVSRIDLSVDRLEQTLWGLIRILDVQKAENKAATTLYFADILDKLKKEMENKIVNAHVYIQKDFTVTKIEYVEAYLESIMRSLLSNAIKYSKEDEPLRIHIGTHQYQDYVVLEVTDNGVGIDLPRFKNKIFKPFERLSNKSLGQGVGLHLIKTMAEKNGGKVEVISKLGEGTTFKVYLKPYVQK